VVLAHLLELAAPGPFFDQLRLPFGKGGEQGEKQLAHGRAGVDVVLDQDQLDAVGVERVEDLQAVAGVAPQTIDLGAVDDGDAAGLDRVQQGLQRFAVEVLAAVGIVQAVAVRDLRASREARGIAAQVELVGKTESLLFLKVVRYPDVDVWLWSWVLQ
jgi:hypothetical protein